MMSGNHVRTTPSTLIRIIQSHLEVTHLTNENVYEYAEAVANAYKKEIIRAYPILKGKDLKGLRTLIGAISRLAPNSKIISGIKVLIYVQRTEDREKGTSFYDKILYHYKEYSR